MEKSILILCIVSANIYTSLAASQSECTSGQKWDGANCVTCEKGTYQTQSAQTSCIKCPTGTYNINEGSTSSSACTKCGLGTSNNNEGSTVATACANCATGYYTSSTGSATCDICNQGYYKDSATNTCKDCKGVGYQPSVGQSDCITCPTGSKTDTVGPISSTNCDKCTKGYYKSGSSCVACPVGEYSDTEGATTCKKCADVTNKKESTTKAEASTAESDCLCKKGYYKVTSGEQCVLCEKVGEYKETVSDDTACKTCVATYGEGSTTVSKDVANTALSACVCGPGYYGTTTCKPCDKGQYNDAYGQTACTKCPTYFGRTTLATGSTASGDCKVCDKGYYGAPGTGACTACAAGTYKTGVDDGTTTTAADACVACTADGAAKKTNSGTINTASTAQTDCVCNKGFYKVSDTECKECITGEYKDVMSDATSCTKCPDGTSTAKIGSTSSSDCLCGAGYYLSSGSCLQCKVGTYQDKIAQTSCKKCNPGKTTAAVGKKSADDCICAVGYGTTNCIACDIGYYKTSTGDGTCTQCATERTTLSTAQTAISACVCKAGYYLSGTTCTECPVGKYSTAANSASCTDCPTGLTTLSTKSDSASDCVCKAGYFTSNAATTPVTCAQCEKGKYNANTNQNSCESCTSGLTTTSTGSTSASDCITSSTAGNYGNSTGTYPCAVGTYQDKSDQIKCTECSTGATTTATGSTSSAACICNVGYAGTANSCTACYYNTYQDTTGQSACKECDSDKVTNTMASTASSQCVDDNNSTTTRVGKFTITSLTYISDYGSSGTTNYNTLYTALATELNKVYSSKSTTFSRVSSMEFSSGSVKTEYDIIFNGDADLTNSQLEDALKNSLTSGNNLGSYTIDTSTIDVSDKGLGWAAILGIVLGCLAFVVIVLVVVVICCYYANNRDRYGDRYSRGGGRQYGAYSNRGYSNMQNYKNFDRQGRVPPTMDPGYKNPPQAIPRPGYPDSMGSEKGMNMPNPNLYHWRNSNGWPNYDYGQVTGRREPQTGFDRKNDYNLNKDARPPQPRNRASQMQNNNMNPYRAYQMDDRQGNLY